MATTAAKTGQAVIRADRQGIALRAASDGGMPTLFGHFAVFNRWAEIDSWSEGHFLERIAPGAFKKTFQERRPKALFQHGQDPQVGDKPLGPIGELREDEKGGYYEVPLLDTVYNRELIPGLEAGLYGASFAFNVIRQEREEEPDPSVDNPGGLPERTIKEAAVFELGPVTWPAYADATAGARSLTDRVLFAALEQNPTRARELLAIGQAHGLSDLVETLRMDVEDLDTLAQMIQLASVYIEEQDEPADQANVPKMEAIIASLTALIPYEVAEDEGDEPEDEDADRGNGRGAPPAGAGAELHPTHGRRAVPQPLYGAKQKEAQPWRLP